MTILGLMDELGPEGSTRRSMERRMRLKWSDLVAPHLRDGSFRQMHQMHHEDFKVLDVRTDEGSTVSTS